MTSAQIFALLVLVVLRDDIARLVRVVAERIRRPK